MKVIGWLMILAGPVVVLGASPTPEQAPAPRPAPEDSPAAKAAAVIAQRKQALSPAYPPVLARKLYALVPLAPLLPPPPGLMRISPYYDVPRRPVVVVNSPVIVIQQSPLFLPPSRPRMERELVPCLPPEKPREEAPKAPERKKPAPPIKEKEKEPKKKPPERPARPGPRMPGPPAPADDPAEEAERLEGLGRESFKDLEYGRAAQRFAQASRLAPDLPMPRFLLAQALLAQGKYHDAADAIVGGLKRNPDWPKSKFRPMELYGAVGEYPEQMAALTEVQRRHPDDPDLLFLLAYQLWFDGRKEEARPLLRRALPRSKNRDAIERFLRALPPEEL
jgi:tetratricopeptide (TPR) repeat protein